ncbi:hypothetical protein HYD56_02870 [Mycoplasmopsis bovis]|nr:hypothetical protein [Mycoplasmopsis bovis]QQH66644.1 hypothetical protein HYD56_02870 [Mycoplasmopsis bovis]
MKYFYKSKQFSISTLIISYNLNQCLFRTIEEYLPMDLSTIFYSRTELNNQDW